MTKNKTKPLHYIVTLIVFIICWNVPATAIEAKASENLTIPQSYVKENTSKKTKETVIPLFTEAHVLQGVTDQVTTYYTIPEEGVENASVTLHFTYSDLLLDGSSITILIDGKPVQSVFLEHEKVEKEMQIPLTKETSKPGFHTVEIAFYGIVMENICVDDENRANWLSVTATSALYFEKNPLEEAFDLSDFPYPFVQAGELQAINGTIVVPNGADDATLMAALHLSSMMHRGVPSTENIPIITEDDLEQVDSHLIALGKSDEWQGVMKEILQDLEKPADGQIYLGNHLLEGKEKDYQLTVITANDSEILREKINFLTDDRFREQLSGNAQLLTDLPQKQPAEKQLAIPLSDFQMPDVTLAGNEQYSLHYFYPLPTYVDLQKETTLHLRMKVAETLFDKGYTNHEAELMILINDVPHSIRVQDLKELDDDGFYEVDIKVAGDVLQKQPFISVQFVGNGLRQGNYCEKPNDAHWIFIENTTHFSFGEKEQNDMNDFSSWPDPFVQSTDPVETVIVYDGEQMEQLLPSLQQLVNHLGRTGNIDQLQLIDTKNVVVDEIKDDSIIFVGEMAAFVPLLDEAEDLLINMTDAGDLLIDFYGFIRETASFVSWIQPSIWNNGKTMAFFSIVNADTPMSITDRLVTFLENNKVNATIIVENEAGQIFTNETTEIDQPEEEVAKEKGSKQLELNRGLLLGFLAIILVSFIVLIIGLRIRRKKDGRKE